MSRFDEIKSALGGKLQTLFSRIGETSLYYNLAERYNSLNPQAQRIVRAVGILLFVGIILFVPLNAYLDSKNLENTFEDRRNLIKDLFKSYRDSGKEAGISSPPAADILVSQITNILQSNQLLPEQIVSVVESQIEGNLIPSKLVKHVVSITLSKLNIRQIVDIGNIMLRQSEAVKMKDLNISAHPNMEGFFDVTYKLYALNVPEARPPDPIEPEDLSPKKKSKKLSESESSAEEKETDE